MSARSKKKLYRSRDGEVLGVCKGIAEWKEFPVDQVRLVFILLVVLGGMSIWIYFILALILPPEPRDGEDRRNHQDRRMEDEEYEELKKQHQKMTDDINKERDWENRFSKDK